MRTQGGVFFLVALAAVAVARPAYEDLPDAMTLSRQHEKTLELQNKHSEKFLRYKSGVVDTDFRNNGPEDDRLLFRVIPYHAGSSRMLWTIGFGENQLLKTNEGGFLEMAEAGGSETDPADGNLFEAHLSSCKDTYALQEFKGKRRFIAEDAEDRKLKMLSFETVKKNESECKIKGNTTPISHRALFRIFGETS